MTVTTDWPVTIYHNPECGTSRNTLALIRHAGIEPTVIEYLKAPPTRATLIRLIEEAMLRPRETLRQKGSPYAELSLDNPGLPDEALIDAMMAHPILINRPFVVTPLGTRLCRPSEVVLDILPPITRPFTKEDGEVVTGNEERRGVVPVDGSEAPKKHHG
ncbi:MAG: arsenate reductase (glutaredoxin) [Rudaea sp.]|uniref:arsenate reductase (glutaredoxin) n=1 Tax=Rudaea sp. TaxID=2136325 RepID=UPI00092712FD|nr:arsenate reductase (glutaredoxin) [Rudaea sp.]MBN8884090.1 arsenate reductase (glutaredoxin) [Rudaea sp.]OJY60838.1 MAG: arsenate reductase (glutaredoxin) [Rhodanobacter sp. 68-29]